MTRWWRKRRAPERRPAAEIMAEATALRNEVRICRPGLERMTAIEQRVRELAVEIGALPAAAAAVPADTLQGKRDGDEEA